MRLQGSRQDSQNTGRDQADRSGGIQGCSYAGKNNDSGNSGIYRRACLSRDSVAGGAEKDFADGRCKPYAFRRFGMYGGGDCRGGYPAGLRLGVCERIGDRKDPVFV